ncbi:MAG: hypothetical protein ABR505_08520 [Actinomycetota bacterium]
MQPGINRGALALLAMVALFIPAVCGEDATESAETSSPGDLARYCALVGQLNEEGTEFFSRLGPNTSKSQYETAQAEFVRAHQEELNELSEVAPLDIREYVATVVASQKATADLGPEVPQSEVLQAESHLRPYQEEHCSASRTQS